MPEEQTRRPDDADPMTLHDRQAMAVAKAVGHLAVRYGPEGFSPEAIAQGAVDGACALLIGTGSKPGQVAQVLRTIAEVYDELDHPNPEGVSCH